MATYFLHVKIFSRGRGSKATKAAAYRAGERIRDERSSAVFDHTGREDVAHAEIILPAGVAEQPEMAWARDRSILWNAADHAGRQWNSRVAREVLVFVPPEMLPAQRVDLVRAFSRELSDRYGAAVDFSLHMPRAHADARHHHAHLLMTTRQVGPGGLGARTSLELSGTERHAQGFGPSRDELLWMRERWAQVTNEALREAGLTGRVDHRSYRAQGVDREPEARIPQSVLYAERRTGLSTPAGDAIRARHRERVAARAKGRDELERVVARQRAEGREQALQAAARKEPRQKTPQGALTREEANERRREWRKANADRMNAYQRAYRQRHAEENSAKRWVKYREKLEKAEAVTAARAASGNAAPPRQPRFHSPTEEESAKAWRAYRDQELRREAGQGAPSADAGRPAPTAKHRKPAAGKGRDRKNDLTL